MNSKGQSALEYLMTYGWALVVIVIVVAALVVFGVFSTPTNCSPLTGRLLLKDFSVTSGGIDLAIQNNSTGTITGITLSSSGLTAAGTNPASLGVGDSNAFSLTGTLSGSVNQAVTVSYNSADGLTKTETTTCVANIA